MVMLLAGVESLVPSLGTSWRSMLGTAVVVGVLLLALGAIARYRFAPHRRVLVLGTTELAGKLVRELLAGADLRGFVVGVIDDGSAAFKPALPCLRVGSIESLGKIIEGFEPDLIVCALPEGHDPLLIRELLPSLARGVPVEDGLMAYERLTGKIAIEHATARAVLFSRDVGASSVALVVARALSIIGATGLIVVLCPFLVPVALLIKLDSEGPVFFLHERVGLGGRPFNLIKFRTMRPGAATSEWAVDNVHRTTRVGRWLRRFRIDELPQFLNILRGEMNLVGPRPHPLSNLALFTENIPYYGVRWSVRPGITGWAQIRYGYANDLGTETEKTRYDLHYIKHASLGLDLRILLETLTVVLKGGRSAAPANEPGLEASPVYFGIDHPKTARRVARFSEQRGLRAAPSRPLALVGPTSAEPVSTDGALQPKA
jgi:exopolysaccharide biosynthesis polyprenyl glycosylphosphotransferase